MAAAVMRALAISLLPLASAWAAPPLADPTLPPKVQAAADKAAAPVSPQLQLTRRGPGETMSALLAGRWVRAGESFELGGTVVRVERVTPTAVWIAHGDRREVLEMAPQAAQAVRCRDTENRGSCR